MIDVQMEEYSKLEFDDYAMIGAYLFSMDQLTALELAINSDYTDEVPLINYILAYLGYATHHNNYDSESMDVIVHGSSFDDKIDILNDMINRGIDLYKDVGTYNDVNTYNNIYNNAYKDVNKNINMNENVELVHPTTISEDAVVDSIPLRLVRLYNS